MRMFILLISTVLLFCLVTVERSRAAEGSAQPTDRSAGFFLKGGPFIKNGFI